MGEGEPELQGLGSKSGRPDLLLGQRTGPGEPSNPLACHLPCPTSRPRVLGTM